MTVATSSPTILSKSPSLLGVVEGVERECYWKVVLMTPNKSLQGSGTDKVLGRGRSRSVLEQLVRARVLNRRRAAPELSR